MKKLILLASIFLVFQTSLQAQQTPNVISYQGLIQGTNGTPVKDSTYPITVIIWTDSSDGTPLWQDIFQPEVIGGVFNVLLGSQNPLPSASVMDHPLWISVSLSNFSETSQRSRLSAVPIAINVPDSSITTNKIADGAITWNKMGTEYIPYFRVNGVKVTTGHNSINFTGSDGMMVDYDSTSMSLIFHPDTSLLTSTDREGGFKTLSTTSVALWNSGAGPGPTGTATQVLHGGAYTFSSVDLGTDVGTSILPYTNGGTEGIPQWSTSIGAGVNSATNVASAVAGGDNNHASNIAALVGGGYNNVAYGDDGVVAGGEANTVGGGDTTDPSSYHSVVSGGGNNTALRASSAIAGGTSLMLGAFSFGFNGDNDTGTLVVRGNTVPRVAPLTNLSDTLGGANLKQIAYFGNVNLMLGNVDSVSRELQFFSPQTSHVYSGAHYSSFQAGLQTGNILYTLPISLPSAGQYLKATSVTGTAVGLSWATPLGGGGGGSDSNAWLITGNLGTSAPTNFIGTIDSQAFEIHVNNSGFATGGNQRVMRYAPGYSSPSITGGSSANTLTAGLSGAAILSGGSLASPNRVTGAFSVVVGGDSNNNYAIYSAIVGGENNTITNVGGASAIVGGATNEIDESYSFIGAGLNNRIVLDEGGIVAGAANFIDTSNDCFIGAGGSDTISSDADASGIVTGL